MTADPPALIDRYFHELESGNFEAAAACFSEDVLYSHPPYRGAPPGSPRKEARGRAQLTALFHERGKRTVHHTYQVYVVGNRGFISGSSAPPGGPTGSFLSEFTINGDGLIDYYAAYQTIPGVGSTLES